jgi:hypothetical protein
MRLSHDAWDCDVCLPVLVGSFTVNYLLYHSAGNAKRLYRIMEFSNVARGTALLTPPEFGNAAHFPAVECVTSGPGLSGGAGSACNTSHIQNLR